MGRENKESKENTNLGILVVVRLGKGWSRRLSFHHHTYTYINIILYKYMYYAQTGRTERCEDFIQIHLNSLVNKQTQNQSVWRQEISSVLST